METLEIEQYFDRHAPRYDELVGTIGFQLNDAYDYLAKYIDMNYPDIDRVRILELGIGTGQLTERLLRNSSRAVITGVDASSQMLEGASRNLKPYQDRVSLIHGEFPQAIPETEYECVVSAIALSFYTIDFATLFRKVHQVLRPGGLFVYAVNVAHNSSSVDSVLARMLRERLEISSEQLNWMKGIRGNVKLFQVPTDWHRSALLSGGFCDVDCIYLRHKLGIFSAVKPRIAI
jgi:ubiquinone/menaquinone biosynthesis C-methylase UbiE